MEIALQRCPYEVFLHKNIIFIFILLYTHTEVLFQ